MEVSGIFILRLTQFIAVTAFLGALLSLVGLIFPSLNRILPRKIKQGLFRLEYSSTFGLPIYALERFVRMAERISRVSADAIRSLPVVVILLVLIPFSAYQLLLMDNAVEVSVEIAKSVILACVLALVVIIGLKFVNKNWEKAVKALRLRRHMQWAKWDLEFTEESIRDVKNELQQAEGEEEAEEIRNHLDILSNTQAHRERKLHDLEIVFEDDKPHIKEWIRDAQAGAGITFFMTLFLLAVWWFLLRDPFANDLLGVLSYDITKSWKLILYSSPVLLMLLVLFQTLVASGWIVIRPYTEEKEGDIEENAPNKSPVFLFFLAVTISIFITFSALLLGHKLNSSAYVPLTLQMLGSNAVLDGLTIAITVLILSFVTNPLRWLLISDYVHLPIAIIAIFADLAIAASLVILSLYFGLWGTEQQLTLGEILNVLRGLSVDGSSSDFGPYFWVMHTVFIPTTIYLIMILLTLFNRFIIELIKLVFYRGAHRYVTKELTYLGSVMTAFSGVIAGIAYYTVGLVSPI